jgi:hypothetical protein
VLASSVFQFLFRFLHPAIDFGDRLRDVIAPPLVAGRGELRFELGACQAERFEGTNFFGIAYRFRARLLALALELLHPFLDP